MKITLVHLYPTLLNLYGDRGNIITLCQRCAWRGIDLNVVEVGLGERFPSGRVDLLFMGGDQDREQAVVVDDLRSRHSERIQGLIADDVPFLAVCGSYQLLQNFYRPAVGPDLIGVGVFDAHTVHPGAEVPRCVGNIVVTWNSSSIVGFENHGGRTYLGPGVEPLAQVRAGFGNNGEDATEGARVRNAFGTYIHGSLLPKNPTFADYLLEIAVRRIDPSVSLEPIDDVLEHRAHNAAAAMALAEARGS